MEDDTVAGVQRLHVDMKACICVHTLCGAGREGAVHRRVQLWLRGLGGRSERKVECRRGVSVGSGSGGNAAFSIQTSRKQSAMGPAQWVPSRARSVVYTPSKPCTNQTAAVAFFGPLGAMDVV
jgi:hypothetical protein